MSTPFSPGRALLGAALILSASALLAWATPAYLTHDQSRRLLSALLGAMVVVYANAIPKVMLSRKRLHCDPARDQAARRYAGWSLVLGGIGYMLASLFAPISIATPLAGSLLAASLLLAVVRCLRVSR